MSPSLEALLPTELLEYILENASPKDLPRAALVCRRWNIIATRFLYRYVYYTSKRTDPIKHNRNGVFQRTNPFPDWSSPYRQTVGSFNADHRRNTSLITNYKHFLRTIEESKQLRDLVRGVSLFYYEEEFVDCKLLQVLKTAPNVKIHISATEILVHDPDVDEDDPYFRVQKNITSLHISQDYYLHFVELRKDDVMGYDPRGTLQDLMAVPDHLESVSIAGHRGWDSFEFALGEMEETMDLTSLSFPNSSPPSDGLYEVLSWPKALKSFHFEIDNFDHVGDEYEDLAEEVESFVLLELQMALHEWQGDTLEELFIFGNDCMEEPPDGMASSGQTMDLHEFSQLKRVGLPITWLSVPYRLYGRKEFPRDKVEILETWQILPPKLEQLQIQFPHNHLSQYVQDIYPHVDSNVIAWISRMQKEEWAMPGELIWILKRVCEMRARYPKLREVVLWHVCSELDKSCDLSEVPYWDKLVRYFLKAGIKLYSVCNDEPPLFSG